MRRQGGAGEEECNPIDTVPPAILPSRWRMTPQSVEKMYVAPPSSKNSAARNSFDYGGPWSSYCSLSSRLDPW